MLFCAVARGGYCGAVPSFFSRRVRRGTPGPPGGGGRGVRPRATDFWRSPKVSKRLLRCPLRRALAPRRGHSPYSLPPKNPKTRRPLVTPTLIQPCRLQCGGGSSCLVDGILRASPRLWPCYRHPLPLCLRRPTCLRDLLVVSLFVVPQRPPCFLVVLVIHL